MVKLEKIEETPHMFILKDKETGFVFRVPKDPEKIPEKSICIGPPEEHEKATKATVGFVKRLLKKKKE